ncbi:hypothetical protein GUK30_05630 [Rhizobium leguminosarum]|nr:hypothetical protein [Rhizobium ruizarguesonis]NEJ02912.1 hypothetical protein [Rhizobium ruizarguesonis]NEJ18873.1 hypothetical protein [Rhizobium leguminosarum]NEJ39968.1 hypothetical protein [Rhizobium ruizarguesonis]
MRADFCILSGLRTPAAGIRARTLHVCNSPSSAATSAIPIGKMIVDRLLQ